MASIRRRPNGKFQASISMGKDSNGKRIVKYVTKDTMKECRKAVWEIESLKKSEVR